LRFLFERLAGPVAGLAEVSAEPYGAIADNLQCIVTSARLPQTEEGEIDLLNFGMPSVTTLGRDAVSQRERYQQRLSRLIERYEPRLTHVRVETAADGNPMAPWRLVVVARLRADLEQEERRFPIELNR